jgi:hypothetical protein
VVGANGSLRIIVANTSNTFNTSNAIVGTYSGATATPSSVAANNLIITPKGIVESSNTTLMVVRRQTFADIVPNTLLLGAESGQTANVLFVTEDSSSNVIGNNAIVDAAAGVTDGTVESVEIINSGFCYQDGEEVVLTVNTNPIQAIGTVVLSKQGVAEGYYKGSSGFLNDQKYIQDNYYYQEYSYELQTGLDISQYESYIKNTTHVAGTKMFGKFAKQSTVKDPISLARNTYDYTIVANLANTSTGTFTVGELITQGNTASGKVLTYSSNSTINTLVLVNISGSFSPSAPMTGANSGAIGNISDLNITLL